MKRLSFASLFLLLAVASSAQTKTYFALGDSVAFGFQPNDYSRNNGDKGYVKPVADWLGTQQGGVRPTVINLAIPGETSASFFDTSEVGGLLNSNYPLLGRKSQADTFKAKVASELSKGHVPTHVTFAIGANDLLNLETTQFLALPLDEQKAQVDQVIAVIAANAYSEFTLIRQQLPNAVLVVPGYYNPYNAYPGTPVDIISLYAIPRLNSILLVDAFRFGGTFADTYGLFLGHELEWTWIAQNDVHPNDAGYAQIGQLVIQRLLNRLPSVPGIKR